MTNTIQFAILITVNSGGDHMQKEIILQTRDLKKHFGAVPAVYAWREGIVRRDP